ncbi:MAG: RNA polymerase sigma factor [Labilithrix sp.]|nr:RNA polymerase sigma factor [Labilithrix sp.]
MAADPLEPVASAARLGDVAATRRLLEAIGPTVLAVVRAVLGRANRDVEDVVQDSLVGVVRALPSFRGESSVLHFARSIALRRALGHRRADRRAHRDDTVALEELPEEAPLRDPGESPAASVLATHRRQAFRALLDDLRPEQAEALLARVVFGCSIEEIAAETGSPHDTVKSRLRLAKSALRARIQNDPLLLELSESDDDEAL